MIRRITRSLPARLLAVFVLTSLVYIFGSRYAVQMVYDADYLRQIVGAHISLHAEYVVDDIGNPPDLARAQAIVDRIPVDIRIQGPDVDWTSDDNFPRLETLPFGPLEFFRFPEDGQRELEHWARTLTQVELARHNDHVFVSLADGDYRIVFASPRIAESRGPELTRPTILLIAVLVLALCYLVVRWLVRPIDWIKEGAARIGQGELNYRIPTTRNDDLGELAVDINRMAEDVQEMLEAKRQLLLAISHELRSPLTRAKVAVEFIDDERIRGDLLDDIRQMERLIADLLESERLNTRHTKLQRTPVELGALIRSVLEEEFADRSDRISLHLPSDPVTRHLDATRVRLLVRNLVENALRVTPEGGRPVEVTLQVEADGVELRILDHGDGIPAEHLARVTEPFYRADPARSRTTGGFGLGLYLCRRIAEAHDGSLRIRSEVGVGTEVIARLPDQTPEPGAAATGTPALAAG